MQGKSSNDIAGYIDHTLLKPEATQGQIQTLCSEALENKFFGVCVNSSWIPLVTSLLKGSSVQSVSVVGFPLGAMSSWAKAKEAEWCVKNGASEIDMVIQVGPLKDKQDHFVLADIREVVTAAQGKIVKVIIETGLLNDEEKIRACRLSQEAGAHFVKTCTGFAIGGAEVTDVALMKKTVGDKMAVKASGGIKTTAQALALIEAGATRLGTSSGVALVKGRTSAGGY